MNEDLINIGAYAKGSDPLCDKAIALKEKIDNYLKLSVDNDYLVPSLETGLVIFTGVKEDFGNVVIIQQVDGVDIWYGNLTNINVKLYDYVDKGTLIGSCNNVLYLVHKKDGEFLNYEDKI